MLLPIVAVLAMFYALMLRQRAESWKPTQRKPGHKKPTTSVLIPSYMSESLPKALESVQKQDQARQQGEVVPARYEIKGLTKDNQTKWMDVTDTPINYEGKTATNMIIHFLPG